MKKPPPQFVKGGQAPPFGAKDSTDPKGVAYVRHSKKHKGKHKKKKRAFPPAAMAGFMAARKGAK